MLWWDYGGCTVTRFIRNEIPHLLQLSASEPSFHCPISPFKPLPLTTSPPSPPLPFLSLSDCLVSFFFFLPQVFYLYPFFHLSIPFAWFPLSFLLYLSVLIDISLTLFSRLSFSLDSFFLSLTFPSVSVRVGDRPQESIISRLSLSVPVCLQGKQLWWGLMHYWSLSPLRIYLLMHTCRHTRAPYRSHTDAAACTQRSTYEHVNMKSHLHTRTKHKQKLYRRQNAYTHILWHTVTVCNL